MYCCLCVSSRGGLVPVQSLAQVSRSIGKGPVFPPLSLRGRGIILQSMGGQGNIT
jgi:hypothetical protein